VKDSKRQTARLRREGLSVEPIELEQETVLVLCGEFDLTGVEAFTDAVSGIAPETSIVLDMRKLSFLDSSGLGALVQLYRRACSEGWSPMVVGPQPPVALLLRLSGLDECLTIVDGTPQRLS
jgi:anti-anti-sigma factor